MPNSTRGRRSDKEKIKRYLFNASSASHSDIIEEFDFTNEKYEKLLEEMKEENQVELFRRRGGGVRLTSTAEKSLKKEAAVFVSNVKSEKKLYDPFIKLKSKKESFDKYKSVVLDTSRFRQKGKWQNPDATKISLEEYRILGKSELIVSSFELKQFKNGWGAESPFEAAAHLRFSHESTLVLECPTKLKFEPEERQFGINELIVECQRNGVGIDLMVRRGKGFRLKNVLDAVRQKPDDSLVEEWLEYIIYRNRTAKKEFTTKLDRDLDD